MSITEAHKKQTKAFMQAMREGDGWLPECCTELNDANRELIAAILEKHGQAWLGNINLHVQTDREQVIRKYTGAMVYNFDVTFVIPKYDAQLEWLIRERDDSEYTGTNDDEARVERIMTRIEELGGYHLIWS